jgi:hypothetical protein
MRDRERREASGKRAEPGGTLLSALSAALVQKEIEKTITAPSLRIPEAPRGVGKKEPRRGMLGRAPQAWEGERELYECPD